MMGQAGRPLSHYLLYPALPCATLRYPAALLCLSFSILRMEIMQEVHIFSVL